MVCFVCFVLVCCFFFFSFPKGNTVIVALVLKQELNCELAVALCIMG